MSQQKRLCLEQFENTAAWQTPLYNRFQITWVCNLQVATQKQKHFEEIQRVHLRVKAAVASKDETIASLKQQMHSTEQMLAQQHAELQSTNS